jgi:hypothetical protein
MKNHAARPLQGEGVTPIGQMLRHNAGWHGL